MGCFVELNHENWPNNVPESLTVPNETMETVNTDELVNISHYENVVGDEAASGCITGIADVDQNDGARCSLITTEHAGETPAMATMGQFIENVYFFV